MKIRIMCLNWAYRHIKLDVNTLWTSILRRFGTVGDIYKRIRAGSSYDGTWKPLPKESVAPFKAYCSRMSDGGFRYVLHHLEIPSVPMYSALKLSVPDCWKCTIAWNGM